MCAPVLSVTLIVKVASGSVVPVSVNPPWFVLRFFTSVPKVSVMLLIIGGEID